MAKRKRTSPSPALSDAADPAERILKSQKRQCTHRIAAAQKPLVAALRLGAGFERQKHSRRKKTAQAKGDDKGLARLEAEYAVLKSLNIEQVADQHLRKTVGKVKTLKDHDALREYVDGVRKGSGDAATLNVLARLYKVAAVKTAVDEAVDDLKRITGNGDSATALQSRHEKKAKVTEQAQAQVDDQDQEMLDACDEDGDVFAAFSARIAAPSSGEDDSGDSISADERPPSIGDSESEHDPDADLELGSDGEEDDDSFYGFSDEQIEEGADMASRSDGQPKPKMTEKHSSTAFISALSIANSDSSSDSEAIDSDDLTAAKTNSKASSVEAYASSNFFPALSHANYLPGSDSEASDLDEAPRKNRRGQRARQKIAELKYGAKAKHLDKLDRKKGWDPKRGAVSDDRRRMSGRRGMHNGRGPQQSGGNAEPLGSNKKNGSTKRDDKGELHPSWQAAKAAKERKMLKIDVQAPQGKKVVFD